MIKIEANVPVRKKGKKRIYPFEEMKQGDSFFIDGKKRVAVYLAWRYIKTAKKLDWEMTFHQDGSGVRVWRIK